MKHETRKILDKIKYEKAMFQFTAQYLLDHQNDNCLIHGAILESFLIHARIIHEFIVKESYQDDIKANELVDNISLWEEKKNNLFSNLGISKEIGGIQYRHGWYELIHKHLAHFTKARLTFKPSWPYLEIKKECEEALIIFIECLSDEKKEYLQNKS